MVNVIFGESCGTDCEDPSAQCNRGTQRMYNNYYGNYALVE